MNGYFNIVLFLSLFCMVSCENNNTTQENKDFNVDLEISNLICFPDDSICMTFGLRVSDGVVPYAYNWFHPDTLTGAGPFSLGLRGNLLLNAEVTDADGNTMVIHKEILKDTIDFPRYDYRNRYAGFYECDVVYHWTTEETPGNWVTRTEVFKDTIEVLKPADTRTLKIWNIQDVSLNYRDMSFTGYHADGYFREDSIHFYYFATPVGLYNWSYDGKKLD